MSDEHPFSKKVILLVEDNEDDVLIMRTVFRKTGLVNPVQVVRNGEEAIAYLSGTGDYKDRERYPRPSVILLDLNMPRVNGFEFLKWLRAQEDLRRIVVEVITASSRPGDVERAFDAGANGYMVKPTSVDKLIAMMSAWHHMMEFRSLPEY